MLRLRTVLKTGAIVIVISIVALLFYAAIMPDTFTVRRTISINAPPEKIFSFIDDLHKWDSWSPYEKIDPAMKRTYSGASIGKGSVYEWDGDWKVGKGRLEIAETSTPSKVKIKLDMIRPIEGHNIVEFTLEGNGDSTIVTWAMHGSSPYISKVIGLFVNMDRMIGKQFETGLGNLKAVSEK
jgi:carbon monoxide dehydrogenase subunit G